MLIETTGDLFEGDRKAIAHGVNCIGVMGAGVASVMRDKYPLMYLDYRRLCDTGKMFPGDVFSYMSLDGVAIYNLATQYFPGADARLSAIDRSVGSMLAVTAATGIRRVSMPRIGCGIGGLQWDDVRTILELASSKWPTEIEVVTLPPRKA